VDVLMYFMIRGSIRLRQKPLIIGFLDFT